MKEIRTEIFIAADATTVWNILMDFATFPEWNPFLKYAQGETTVGSNLKVTIWDGKRGMDIRPKVTANEPLKQFAWLGSMGLGAFNGNHIFELEERDGGTLFIHREKFSGWLHGLLLKQIGETTRNGFIEMNRALKARAEGIALSDK